jgi:SAM-dependent methyltransferase
LAPRAALRWAAITPLLRQLRPDSILEIGCGQGSVGARLAGHGSYLGIEPNDQSYASAARRVTAVGGRVLHCADADLPAGTRADLVCAFEVLEHIEDDVCAARRWLSRVNPGGHLLLSVPADPAAFGPWDVLVGHYRRYSRADLERVLAAAGATAPLVWHYGWPLGGILDTGRDRVARRRLDRDAAPRRATLPTGPAGGPEDEQAARTAGSGRLLQPGPLLAPLIRAWVAPFSLLQRRFPDRGTGLLALCGVATLPV